MEYLIVALSSYLLGSIPFGFILTKIFLKKDIRDKIKDEISKKENIVK